jgi:hypothetical protein
MPISKNQIQTVTLDPDLKVVQDAINKYRSEITNSSLSFAQKEQAAIQFEDVINPSYGIIQNQSREEIQLIGYYCLELYMLSQAASVTLNLYQGLLPNIANNTPKSTLQVGKKLFPRTETVLVNPDGTIENTKVLAKGLGLSSNSTNTADKIVGTSASAGAGVSATGKVLNSDGVNSSLGSGSGVSSQAGTGVATSGAERVRSQSSAAAVTAASLTDGSTIAVTPASTLAPVLDAASKSVLSPDLSSAIASAASAAKTVAAANLPPQPTAQNQLDGNAAAADSATIPAVLANTASESVVATAAAAVAAIVAAASETVANANTTATTTAAPDPLFDLLDAAADAAAQAYKDTSISNIGVEQAALLPAGLLGLISAATSNGSSKLEEDMAQLCTNPGSLVANVIASIIYYANNSYANLDSALAVIAADSNLATQYAALKVSLAGSDGLSGTLATAKAYEEHSLRVAGLLVENTSPFASETWDSTTQNLTYDDLAAATSTEVVVFDATRFRSAKYYIQATSGSEHQMTEYSVIHDNAIVYGREVMSTYTIDPFVTLTSTLSGTNVSINATSTLANTNLVIYGIKLKTAKSAKSYPEMSQHKIIENHKIMKSYFGDDVDYVAMQTGAITNTGVISTLARTINDLVPELTGPSFVGLSTPEKQTKLTDMASALNTKASELQGLVDSDHNNFVMLSKRAEVLKMASLWSESNEDPAAKALMNVTLKQSVRENLV